MGNKKNRVWLPVILSLCLIAGMFIGYRIKENLPNGGIFYIQKQQPVQEVLDLIKNKYVDKEDIDSLSALAIQSMLGNLDPHTVFMPAEDLKTANEDIRGMFFGIGIEFNVLNDTTNVTNVLKGGPSDKAGLKMGDKLIYVQDSLIAGNKTTTATLKNLLRGEAGSKVNISVWRNDSIQKLTVSRGAVPLYSLDAAYMITDTVGYIRLNMFSENTYKEFMSAMEKLQARGMKALIFDLRDNGGGVLTEATHIADEFLSGNKLITYTIGAHSPRKDYVCDKEGVFETGRLIVLANEGTASASEVLIGALQDYDRATIVGRRTFGKGLVQEQFELSDGSGLRLTVARYFTPLGRSIQKSYENGKEAYSHDIMDRYKNGEMANADSIHQKNEKQYITKSGRKLFGGGGITPDVFVPVDTIPLDHSIMRSMMTGALTQFVYLNYLHHQNEFTQFTDPKLFQQNYKVDDSTLKKFKTFAARDSIQFDFNNTQQKTQAEKQIKIFTARQIWQTQGYFEASNPYDEVINRALSIIKGDASQITKK